MVDRSTAPGEIQLLDPEYLGKDRRNPLANSHLDGLARVGSAGWRCARRRAGHAGGDVIGSKHLGHALLGRGERGSALILKDPRHSSAADLLLEPIGAEAKVRQV